MQGLTDIALNARGLAQADEAADLLAHDSFEAVYSSPLCRAHTTAETVARRHALAVRVDERLREINVGSWSGLTVEECDEDLPGWRERLGRGEDFRRSSSGETAAEVARRAMEVVGEIAERHPDGSVLVVSHGVFIQQAVAGMLRLDGHGAQLAILGNIGRAVLTSGPAGWRLSHYGS